MANLGVEIKKSINFNFFERTPILGVQNQIKMAGNELLLFDFAHII